LSIVCYRDGILAADTRIIHSDSGIMRGTKLFRKKVGRRDHILGFCGSLSFAMLYLDWYGSGKAMPEQLRHIPEGEHFGVLILIGKDLYEGDTACRPVEVEARYHAIGSGAQAALGAMRFGASAYEAANIACEIDPNCGRPVVIMSSSSQRKGKSV
jgi:ATP-dependent protease HslVU (ClpYQ) peptidase subunit